MARKGELDETLPSGSDAGRTASLGNTETRPADGAAPPAEARDPAVPTTISRFEVDGKLGAGAMGVVLRATDPVLGRTVALKLMRDRTPSTDRTRRFVREAQAMAKVVHENVIVVHEVGTYDGQVYVAMEHVGGSTLAQWQRGRPWREIVETYVRAGRGLAAAHVVGLVHRDFKPENVLIGEDGRVRVTDFGLVSALEGAGESETLPPEARLELDRSLTHTGALLGTPRYMAPEQHMGQSVDQRADQYAFCASLYEALYGTAPYEGSTYAELAKKVLEGDPPSPPRSRVPSAIKNAILRGLSRNRDERFSSMPELLAVISDALAAPSPWRSRKYGRLLALAILVVVVGTSLIVRKMNADARRAEALEEELDRLKTKSVPMAASVPTSGSGAPPVASISDADRERARKAFDGAQTAYVEGRYDEAARGFIAANEYWPSPLLLYNAAAAYQMQGKKTKDAGSLRAAMRMFRQYLAQTSDPDERAKVEKALVTLEALATELEK